MITGDSRWECPEAGSKAAITSSAGMRYIRAEVVKRGAAGEYINEALQIPEVSQYVRKGLYAKSLYMIIGVATCKKLSMSHARTRETMFSADLDANLAVLGPEAGAGLSIGNKASSAVELEIQEECDFSCRVGKFQYSRRRRIIREAKDFTDGALFDRESGTNDVPLTDTEAEAIYSDEPVFDEFESEDEAVYSSDGVVIHAFG
ncbi:hypothetical protein INS49_010489 [Diaporthe citri]|uniref:uncharacterized protein n=1 Tax=Diaporthe citri TaxID=83186 RepID=UPI001C8133A7|nr:uncharacterized protein INS49_010489 [Diaporthe citri]KAG6362259.1 hypothetical protein INS49_010489 [Diaporthe citri]